MSDPNSTATTNGANVTNPDQWIRTRLCYCDAGAPTDCRFHSQQEKGWEECPNLSLAKAGKKLGRWLWARNPAFGKISAAAEESLMEEAA